MPEETSTGPPVEGAIPDSLVGSGGEFERSKGNHLLPPVSAVPDALPPSAAIVVQPPVQALVPTESAPPSPPPQSAVDPGD
jgi:hypothetical protein